MRLRFPILCLAIAAAILASCSKDEEYHVQPPSLISLKASLPMTSSGSATLRFDEVVSDTRCPANALCTWAGIAIAKFTLRDGREELPFMLSVMPGYPKQDTIIKGYYIEFSDLKPYPGIPAEISGQPVIQAEMRIRRLR